MAVDFLSRFTEHGSAVLLSVLAAAVATCTLLWGQRLRDDLRPLAARILLADALLVIALMTLLRASGGGKAVNLIPGAEFALLEFAANAALFVPAGGLAWLAFRQRALALVAIGGGLPILIEALQYQLSLGRISDVNDVAANALGAALGAGVVAAVRRLGTGQEDPPRQHARSTA